MRRKPYREKLAEVTSEIRERNEPLTREIFEILIRKSYRDWETDRKSTRLNSSHSGEARMPSSA